MEPTKQKPVRALVLAGGGAKGSYQVGVYKALRQLGWKPDIITGASVGSLNGILFALDTPDAVEQAERLWLSLDNRDVLTLPAGKTHEELRDFVLDTIRGGGLDLTPLGELIDELVDEDAVRAAPVRYGLVMTEMDTLKSIACPLEEIPGGKLRDYLLASSACFPALRPREIDGVKYIDGGWRDNMPLDLAAAMGATELLGVDIDGIGVTKPNLTGLPTRILRSHWDLGPLFDFDGGRAKRNIAIGYMDTLRAFGRLGGTAYGLLPDENGFLPRFIASYQAVLDRAAARVPTLPLTEALARQLGGWPPVFAQNPAAPTRGAIAPLELAAQHLNVPPDVPYTPRLLALSLLGSFDKDPAARFSALLGKTENGPVVGEAAMAAAEPVVFVTALVCQALDELGWF